MSRITITFTMFVVVISIIAGLFACSMSTVEAATRGRITVGSDGHTKTRLTGDATVATSIPWGSDDADYSDAITTKTSVFHTFIADGVRIVKSFVPSFLPNTAAPHGQVTCTIGTGVNQTTVTRDSCDDL